MARNATFPSRRLALLALAVAALLVALVAGSPGNADARQKKDDAGIGSVGIGEGKALTKKAPTCRSLRAGRVELTRRARTRLQARCGGPVASPSSIYWGAWIGEQFTGEQAPWDMSAVSKFEQLAGKSLSLINFSSPFADCSAGSACSFYKFPAEAMENVRSHGAIPFFSWASNSTPTTLNEPDFELGDVIEGRYDNYIREWATAAKQWGHPFFLRFNWEMNGNWFPWAEGVNGNQPGQYVTAWRHVHDIFTQVGATNATWTWCPNVDPDGKMADLRGLYPGDEYVDWTCLDGYNWGPIRHDKFRSFDELFGNTYHEITSEIAPSKPMVIGEVGSTEQGGSKAAWITQMLKDLPTEYPQVKGLQWFEKNEDADWPIESSSSSAAAFAAGIQSPAYLGNQFASIGSSAIQPAG
jgi:hypothetical protein